MRPASLLRRDQKNSRNHEPENGAVLYNSERGNPGLYMILDNRTNQEYNPY